MKIMKCCYVFTTVQNLWLWLTLLASNDDDDDDVVGNIKEKNAEWTREKNLVSRWITHQRNLWLFCLFIKIVTRYLTTCDDRGGDASRHIVSTSKFHAFHLKNSFFMSCFLDITCHPLKKPILFLLSSARVSSSSTKALFDNFLLKTHINTHCK